MVLALVMPARNIRTQTGPDVGEQIILARKFRPFVRTDSTNDTWAGNDDVERGAFRMRFRLVQARHIIHCRFHRRAKIMKTADRHDVFQPLTNCIRQWTVVTDHPADRIAAHRMTANVNWATYSTGCGINCRDSLSRNRRSVR